MQQTAALAIRPSTVRSRITNGSRLLRGIDGRSASARRYRDLVEEFSGDLGGADKLSTAERAMVMQAAALTVRSEALQAAIVAGEPVSDEQIVRVSNVASRILRTLGTKRRAKEVPKASLRERMLAREQGNAA